MMLLANHLNKLKYYCVIKDFFLKKKINITWNWRNTPVCYPQADPWMWPHLPTPSYSMHNTVLAENIGSGNSLDVILTLSMTKNRPENNNLTETPIGGSEQNKSTPKTEAEFFDEIHSKVLRDFLLAIHTHLYIAHSLVRLYGTQECTYYVDPFFVFLIHLMYITVLCMEIQRTVQFPAINLLRPLKSSNHRTEKSAVFGQ